MAVFKSINTLSCMTLYYKDVKYKGTKLAAVL